MRIQLIKTRSLGFPYEVPAQRQRIGGCNTSGICGNRINNTSGFSIFNLENCTRQQAALQLIGNGIILRGFLDHLNLTEYRCVFYDQFGRFAAVDTQSTNSVVQHITLCGCNLLDLQLNFALAIGQNVIEFDITVLICGIFADQIVGLVFHKETNTVNAFLRYGIDFLNADTCQLLILKLHGCQLTGFHDHVLRRTVQSVTFGTRILRYHINASLQAANRCQTCRIGRIFANHFTICFSDFENTAAQRLVCALDGLDDLQAVNTRIGKSHFIGFASTKLHRFGRTVKLVRIRRFHLRNDISVFLQLREKNSAITLGYRIFSNDRTISTCNSENGTLQRLMALCINFFDE